MMFNRFCQALPSALRDIKVLATSAVSHPGISLHITARIATASLVGVLPTITLRDSHRMVSS